MISSKLLVLLRSFRPEEMRWMAKFVRSPFYNTNEKVVDLFDYIRKYYPDFDSPKLAKEVVFRKIIPGVAFDDRRIRLLMFRLSELAEEFLVIQRLKQETFDHQQYLLEELEDRGLDQLVERKQEEQRKRLEKAPFRDNRYYESLWRLHHQKYFFQNKARKKSQTHSLAETLHYFDAFYFLNKLRYAGELYNRQNIYAESYDILLMDEIRVMVSQAPTFRDNLVFQMYQDVLILMEHRLDTEVFDRLEGVFIENLSLLRLQDQASMIRYLINSTIHLYQNGKTAYLERQFRLYQLGLEHRLFYIEGRLPEATFLNIVITATVLKELEWGKSFIVQSQQEIVDKDKDDAVNLSNAYLASATGDYQGSNRFLHLVNRTGLRYMLRVKSLSLRNYFELFLQDESYYELFLYESKSFEKYIRRNEQISANRMKAYQNFISLLRRIGKMRSSQLLLDKSKIQHLLQEIEAEQVLIAKRWLLETVQSL